jgi:transcriptional regulator
MMVFAGIEQQLTQTKAAEVLGTTQAQVSALMRCRPVSVSVGRLMEFLTILGQDVEVTVKPASTRSVGHMYVRHRAAGLIFHPVQLLGKVGS